MIDFSRANLQNFTLHYIGNKGLGHNLILSEKTIDFPDDFEKETILKYLLSTFKTDVYYQFKGKIDLSLGSVANYAEDLFKTQITFMDISKKIATILHDQTMHPKIPAGPLYVCYFKDVVVDGELVDFIGLFKTEKQDTYLKLEQTDTTEFALATDTGINVNKLDKGCLIFNTDKENGYKISLVDAGSKSSECAFYWQEDFLNTKLKSNAYFHTKHYADSYRAFIEEALVDEREELTRMSLLNKGLNKLTEVVNLNQKEFDREILKEQVLIDQFEKFRKEYHERMDLPEPKEEFEVSATAVKQNKKHMRAVIKLDKNFHIYVHSNIEKLEKGFDEKKGLKFYKLYYANEE
jgi:hypothetical protein